MKLVRRLSASILLIVTSVLVPLTATTMGRLLSATISPLESVHLNDALDVLLPADFVLRVIAGVLPCAGRRGDLSAVMLRYSGTCIACLAGSWIVGYVVTLIVPVRWDRLALAIFGF